MPTNAHWVEQVIARADQAATDPQQWSALAQALHTLLDSRGMAMFTPHPLAHQAELGLAHGDIVDGVPDYFAHWASEDAWLNAVQAPSFFNTAGRVRLGHEFLSDAALRQTAFFDGWARHHSAEQVLSLKITDAHDAVAPTIHLTLFRRFSDPAFNQADRALLAQLWPHLQRAARACWLQQSPIGVGHTGRQLMESTLDAMPAALWMLRQSGAIEFANTAALSLVRTRPDWAGTRGGRLSSVGHLTHEAVTALVTQSTGHELAVSLPEAGRLLRGVLRVTPVAPHSPHALAWPQARTMVTLEAPTNAQKLDAQWLDHVARQFALTAAQAQVLGQLRDGLSVDDIACANGVKVGTVRTHLHELLAKTGCARQVDLVRLALGR